MQRIGFVVYPDFQMIGFAAATVFEVANIVNGEAIYEVNTISESGGRVSSSGVMAVDSEAFRRPHYDMLIVCGGTDLPEASVKLLPSLRTRAKSVRRIVSICTGAIILAEAGSLKGRRATTHWLMARQLQSRYPDVTVEEDRIFIVDGPPI